ncbi:MAG TPA: MBL fold metallo-hydrolase [Chthonomonadaceae bacterium]|nr:MBL fold metallo-hydrolase [Chthonomonadaceae bacterium]
MLLRFLGTSAGELYPGLWCRCRNCEQARGGDPKNRRQSAALYVEPGSPYATAPGNGILIDFPSEIATQAYFYKVELPELQHLLVTHSHGDHWFPYLLRWRSKPGIVCAPGEVALKEIGGPRFTPLPTLHIYGNAAVEAVLHRELGENLEPYALEFHSVRPGVSFAVGDFRVTALHAHHDIGREEAFHYALQKGSHTVLYGLDGDTFLPETREALRSFQFDVVIMESTYGLGNGGNHRNFARLIEEAAWFRAENLMTSHGRIVATHFSPHHSPPHQETSDYLHPHGIVAAWDGMEIRL